MTFQWIPFTGQIDIVHALLLGIALCFFVLFLANRKGKGQEAQTKANTQAPVETPVKTVPSTPSNESALQLLRLFQEEGRLIDFLNEDLTGFSDEDIGAAARVVHKGSQKVLNNYFTLSPVRAEEESTSVTLEAGFDNQAIQLTGKVTGNPPYTGTLIHKGWQADKCELPTLTHGHNSQILAKAEVEL